MKKYLGKKEVLASSMSMGDAYDKGLLQSGLESSRVDRNKQGYLVEHSNGYQSWSPKDVFECSYFLIQEPLDRLKLEYSELFDRYNKLLSFIMRGDSKCVVGEEQFALMFKQKDLMKQYLDILNSRISLFKK